MPRYIVLKGFETALETEKLICFVNLKGLNQRERYIWRERVIEKRIDNLANEYDMIKRSIIFSMQLYLFDENVYLGY